MTEEKTIDKTTSTNKKKSGRTSKEPPSWSELGSKAKQQADLKQTGLEVGLLSLTMLATAFLIPLSASILVASFIGGYYLNNNRTSTMTAGALTAGAVAFLNGVTAALLTLGLTILPFVLIGGAIGLLGGWLGRKLR